MAAPQARVFFSGQSARPGSWTRHNPIKMASFLSVFVFASWFMSDNKGQTMRQLFSGGGWIVRPADPALCFVAFYEDGTGRNRP